MDKKLKNLLRKTEGSKIGIFIDNANWFYPQKELGWDIDFLAIRDFALEKKKGFMALCFEKGVAWEIRKGYHIFLEDIKDKIIEKKSKKSPARKRGVNN